MMEGSGDGSVLVTNGSGCGSVKPKNIRIRISNTVFCVFQGGWVKGDANGLSNKYYQIVANSNNWFQR
jgi:hypothetical protein